MSLTRDEALQGVIGMVADIFERDAAELHAQTRLMGDLPCESIDLLEVSVQLGATFHIFVDEERAFLRSLRYQLAGAPDAAAFLREHYGHLDEARRQQLAAYYTDVDGMALQSPLTLGDIAHWVEQALAATRQDA